MPQPWGTAANCKRAEQEEEEEEAPSGDAPSGCSQTLAPSEPTGRAWVCSRNSQFQCCYPNIQALQRNDYGTHQFLSFPSFLKSSSSS